MFFFGAALFELVFDIQQNFVASSDGVVEIGEGAGPFRLFLMDKSVGFFALHWFFDTVEVFFMLDVGLFDVVELVFIGLVFAETVLIE